MAKSKLDSIERPVIQIPRSGFEKVVEALAIAGIVMSLAALFCSWSDLPDRIPMHYGFGGKPDAYSGQWTVIVLPIIAIVMYAGLSLIRKIPHYYNYPWPITEDNAAAMYKISIVLIACIKMEVVWLFTYIEWITIRVALGKAQGLGFMFLPITFIVMGVTVIVHVIQMSRAK